MSKTDQTAPMTRPDVGVTREQIAVLRTLADYRRTIWLRGNDADVARGMAATKLIALGPDAPTGAIPAAITAEGRALIAAEDRHG